MLSTQSADVCTPKRPRRAQQTKLPYPALPTSNSDVLLFWTAAVQRDEAELAAFEALQEKTLRKLNLGCDELKSPLVGALCGARVYLALELKRSKEMLTLVQQRAKVLA